MILTFGLFRWYWLETWEYAPSQGFWFDSLRYQFGWANLTSLKNIFLGVIIITWSVNRNFLNTKAISKI